MESKRCMNPSCPTSESTQCRKGWTLLSGASALLCVNCGSAYEESKFCDVFHLDQDGWRPCCLCGKRLHCGCIVSRSLIVLRDSGGIFCITCSVNSGQLPEMACNENIISDTSPLDACIAGSSSQRLQLIQEDIQQETSRVPNSTTVLLFEKKLTSSDVGQLNRVIIPKKIAEACLPPVSHVKGVDLLMHDEEGKEWIFLLKYYTSKNNRMYILKNALPWIRSKHLQAGDTITFSRMDPEKKYIIGYRKTSIS